MAQFELAAFLDFGERSGDPQETFPGMADVASEWLARTHARTHSRANGGSQFAGERAVGGSTSGRKCAAAIRGDCSLASLRPELPLDIHPCSDSNGMITGRRPGMLSEDPLTAHATGRNVTTAVMIGLDGATVRVPTSPQSNILSDQEDPHQPGCASY